MEKPSPIQFLPQPITDEQFKLLVKEASSLEFDLRRNLGYSRDAPSYFKLRLRAPTKSSSNKHLDKIFADLGLVSFEILVNQDLGLHLKLVDVSRPYRREIVAEASTSGEIELGQKNIYQYPYKRTTLGFDEWFALVAYARKANPQRKEGRESFHEEEVDRRALESYRKQIMQYISKYHGLMKDSNYLNIHLNFTEWQQLLRKMEKSTMSELSALREVYFTLDKRTDDIFLIYMKNEEDPFEVARVSDVCFNAKKGVMGYWVNSVNEQNEPLYRFTFREWMMIVDLLLTKHPN